MVSGKEIQVENGEYTRIHNAILETLARARLSPLEFRIVCYLLRKTYGFQKKADVISITQFETCGGSRACTIDALVNLVRLKVILREKKGAQRYEYCFNKYIETWEPEVFLTRRNHQIKNFSIQTSKADNTGKANGTSGVDGTSASKVDGTKTSKVDGTHKRKKETIKENPEHKNMFGALARICQLDSRLKAGQIGKTAKSLVAAGYMSADIDSFICWWNDNDFRGRKGEPPTLANVIDKIKQSIPCKKHEPEYATGAITFPDYGIGGQ
jgi:phage replication O-like protein O